MPANLTAPLDVDPNRLVPLQRSTSLFPPIEGKRPGISSVWRWANRGCRGVVLQTRRVGGKRCTTPQLVADFLERLNTGVQDINARTLSARQRAQRRAEQRLQQLGI